ncbi:hypothetical protein CULT_1520009 [[Clostridium] ultunense Esp]|nr:hypothetical protein CULT_1520009 [[Clostridium] ultunense Esp]
MVRPGQGLLFFFERESMTSEAGKKIIKIITNKIGIIVKSSFSEKGE